jgi:hypothetical protein
LFQSADIPVEFDQTAGLKQPSLCWMDQQALERRDIAPGANKHHKLDLPF